MKLNNIKAAFFDMDGTIVSFTTHKISKRDIAAMNKLRKKRNLGLHLIGS